MMLSRVADNLYWMSRYLERAEHTARLLDVTLDLMPDRSVEANNQAWRRLFDSLHLPHPEIPPVNAFQFTQTLAFAATNTGSILYHITAARENARQVREQISSEMWEQINQLYLEIKETTIRQIWRQPHAFFQRVKQGTHLFQGISDSTMTHGEGWHFIQVGQFMERATNTAVLLNIHLQETPGYRQEEAVSNEQYLDWVSLLRSCTAFEAYCKVYTADTRFDYIAEFLLLRHEFPHSVHYAINKVRDALYAIAEATHTAKNSQVNRRAGRLEAMLDFDQIEDVLSEGLHEYLYRIEEECGRIHDSLYQTYINYPVSEKLL